MEKKMRDVYMRQPITVWMTNSTITGVWGDDANT